MVLESLNSLEDLIEKVVGRATLSTQSHISDYHAKPLSINGKPGKYFFKMNKQNEATMQADNQISLIMR